MSESYDNIVGKVIGLTENYHFSIKQNIYRETLRQLLSIFGNIYYLDGTGGRVKVKCTTGKPDRPTGKDENENNLVLPYITVTEIGSEESDERRRVNSLLVNEKIWDEKENRAKRYLSLAPKAINISYQINIWAKYNADLDQIRYAIFTLFNPSLDIRTKFSDYTKAFVKSETDINSQQAGDTTDRLVQKSITISVETYLPSPKFLFTNTGEIKSLNAEIILKDTRQDATEQVTDIGLGGDVIENDGSGGSGGGGITGPLTLSGSLEDVSIINVGVGQVLAWDGSNWVASSIPVGGGGGGGATYLSSLLDVDASSPIHGSMLYYVSSDTSDPPIENKWVLVTPEVQGNVLKVVNDGGGGVIPSWTANNLNSLQDILNPANPGQIFIYSSVPSVGNRWVPITAPTYGFNNIEAYVNGSQSGDSILANATSQFVIVSSHDNTIIPSGISITSEEGNTRTLDLIVNASALVLPQYASSSVSADIESVSAYASGVSSIVSSHINDLTIHFTSGSLSGAYVLTSTNSNLSSLVSNIETSTIGISSTVHSHIGSAVHWELSTLNTNYLNASGDSANAGFYLSSVSATDISATNYYNLPSATIVWRQAQDIVLTVRNETGSTLTIGTPVTISGIQGDVPIVHVLSSVNTHVPEAYGFSNHVAGLVQTSIDHNQNGLIVVEGIIESTAGYNFNTAAFNAGDFLYVSSNGRLSNQRPPAPYESHPVGIVLRAHPNAGKILVKIENVSELNDIVGFNLASSLIDGDLISYDYSTSTFRNKQSISLSGTIKAPTLSGTVVSAGTLHVGGSDGIIKNNNGDIIISATNGIIRFPYGLSAASVSTTTYAGLPSSTALWNANKLQGRDVLDQIPSTGQVLTWNVNRWEPSTVSTGGGGGVTDHGALTGLLDNDHPQYASSSVSAQINSVSAYASGVSSIVSSHINDSSIHFTSGSLSGAYVLTSVNSILSSLVSNIQTSSNNLSGVVGAHIGSAVHWDLATLNTNYINASGDSASALFYFSSLSATTLNFASSNSNTVTFISGLVLSTQTAPLIRVGTTAGSEFFRLTARSDNIHIGFQSGFSQGAGTGNTSLGYNAAISNATGVGNTVVGYQSNAYNTASYNTALGASVLGSNTSGTFNTGVGAESLYYTSGSRNVAVGYRAGYGFSGTGSLTPNNNIVIGFSSNATTTPITYSNTIVIGSGIISTADNQTIIGHPQTSSTILRGTVSSTSLISTSISGTNISGAIVSATTYQNLPSGSPVWNALSLSGYNIDYSIAPPSEGNLLLYTDFGVGVLPKAWRPVPPDIYGNIGSYFNANRIQSVSASPTTPTSNQILVYSGAATAWVPKNISEGSTASAFVFNNNGVLSATNDVFWEPSTRTLTTYKINNYNDIYSPYYNGPFGSLNATGLQANQVSATTYLNLPSGTAIWNANKLQGYNISSTAPRATSGQNLIYDGGGWKPGYILFLSADAPNNTIGSDGDIYIQSVAPALSGLSDISITATPTNHQSLVWSSTKWVPSSVGGGGGGVTPYGGIANPPYEIQFYKSGNLSSTSGFIYHPDLYGGRIVVSSPLAGLNVYGALYANYLEGGSLTIYGTTTQYLVVGPASSLSSNAFLAPSISATTISATTYLNLPSGTATWNANKIQGVDVSAFNNSTVRIASSLLLPSALIFGSGIPSTAQFPAGIYYTGQSAQNAPPAIYQCNQDNLNIYTNFNQGKAFRIVDQVAAAGGFAGSGYEFDGNSFIIQHGTNASATLVATSNGVLQVQNTLSATTISAVNLAAPNEGVKFVSSLDFWDTAILTADSAVTAVTPTNVSSSLSAMFDLGSYYEVRGRLLVSANTAGNGIQVGVTFGNGINRAAVKIFDPTGANADQIANFGATGAGAQVLATTAIPATTTPFLVLIDGVLDLTGSGQSPFVIFSRNEVTGTHLLCRGSFLKWRKYSLTDP